MIHVSFFCGQNEYVHYDIDMLNIGAGKEISSVQFLVTLSDEYKRRERWL